MSPPLTRTWQPSKKTDYSNNTRRNFPTGVLVLWRMNGTARSALGAPLWGVAERSESFKIMIVGGNHSMIKSC